jgi:hypothetical protein
MTALAESAESAETAESAEVAETAEMAAEVADAERASRMFEIGERYGTAFNALDEQHGFIDTIERERLFEVLDQIVDAAEAVCGTELAWARESLVEGTESVRDW